jgi:hypothetical protein
MHRIVGGVLALLLALPGARAGDEPKGKPDKPATPQEQYRALVKEYQDQLEGFSKAYQAAKTQEERNKIFQEKYPQPDKFAPKFLALAEKNPKDPAAVEALVWVVNNTGGMPGKDSPHAKALDLLLREHVASDKIGPVCSRLAYQPDKEAEKFLRTILEKNSHKEVQGEAALALAQQGKNRLELVKRIKDQPAMASFYEAQFGKDYLDQLRKQDPEKAVKEVEKLFESANAKYGDVKTPSGTVGEQAQAQLFALRHPIEVGKPAPEIEGEDLEGQKFKLSDYKGKVVLLDFWGNW